MTEEKKSEEWRQFERSDEDTAKRRDEIAKRMLNTPPKPRKGSTKKDNHEPGSPDRDF